MEGALAKAGAGNEPNLLRRACRHCIHYRVSWDPRMPHGCAAHGFKSSRNPAQVVYDASGLPCQLFMPREARDRGKKSSC